MFQIRTFSGNCYNTYACSLTYEVFLLLFRGTTSTAVFRSENIPRYNERETHEICLGIHLVLSSLEQFYMRDFGQSIDRLYIGGNGGIRHCRHVGGLEQKIPH